MLKPFLGRWRAGVASTLFFAICGAVCSALCGVVAPSSARAEPSCGDPKSYCEKSVPTACVAELSGAAPGSDCGQAIAGYKSCLAEVAKRCGLGASEAGSFTVRCHFARPRKDTIGVPHALPREAEFTAVDGEGEWAGKLYSPSLGLSNAGEFSPDILHGVFMRGELSYAIVINRQNGEAQANIFRDHGARGRVEMNGSCALIEFKPAPRSASTKGPQ